MQRSIFKFSNHVFRNIIPSFKTIIISHSKMYHTNMTNVYEKLFTVHPRFGNIYIKLNCHCIIEPADPQSYPDSDHLKVVVWNNKTEKINSDINVEILGKKDYVKVETEISDSICHLYIPMKYDIEAELENEASLEVKNLESDNINITSQQGTITTKNIKTERCSISMDKGSLVMNGAFQGNLNINAKKLNFKAKRLQGMNMCIQSSNLETSIESSYMRIGNVFAESGNINIKHLHGSTDFHLFKGNLSVNGLHGRLQAIVNEGNLDIQVDEITDNSLIQLEKGLLNLSFMKLSNKSVKVIAPSLDIHSDVDRFGSKSDNDDMCSFTTKTMNDPSLYAHVKSGSAKLFIKDWFTSLGIKTTT